MYENYYGLVMQCFSYNITRRDNIALLPFIKYAKLLASGTLIHRYKKNRISPILITIDLLSFYSGPAFL